METGAPPAAVGGRVRRRGWCIGRAMRAKLIGLMGALALFAWTTLSGAHTRAGLQVDTLARNGHPTHPVWYHDSTAVRVGSKLFLAWNTSGSSVEARAWSLTGSSWVGPPSRVSSVVLDCGCVD